jgi:hypothetical protein
MLFADLNPTINALLGLCLAAIACGAYTLLGVLLTHFMDDDDNFVGLRYAIIAFGSLVWGAFAGLLLGGGLWILFCAVVLIFILHALSWLPDTVQDKLDGPFDFMTMGTLNTISSFPWIVLTAFIVLLVVTTVL